MVRLTKRGHTFVLAVLFFPIVFGISNSFADPSQPEVSIPAERLRPIVILTEMTEPKTYAQMVMSNEFGWDKEQFRCLAPMWGKESAWNYKAKSPTDDYGIPQRHMRSNTKEEIKDFLDNPYTQIEWGLNYIKSRYGTPCKAWEFWNDNRWY